MISGTSHIATEDIAAADTAAMRREKRQAALADTVVKLAIAAAIVLITAAGLLGWATVGPVVAFEMMMNAIWSCF